MVLQLLKRLELKSLSFSASFGSLVMSGPVSPNPDPNISESRTRPDIQTLPQTGGEKVRLIPLCVRIYRDGVPVVAADSRLIAGDHVNFSSSSQDTGSNERRPSQSTSTPYNRTPPI